MPIITEVLRSSGTRSCLEEEYMEKGEGSHFGDWGLWTARLDGAVKLTPEGISGRTPIRVPGNWKHRSYCKESGSRDFPAIRKKIWTAAYATSPS